MLFKKYFCILVLPIQVFWCKLWCVDIKTIKGQLGTCWQSSDTMLNMCCLFEVARHLVNEWCGFVLDSYTYSISHKSPIMISSCKVIFTPTSWSTKLDNLFSLCSISNEHLTQLDGKPKSVFLVFEWASSKYLNHNKLSSETRIPISESAPDVKVKH